MDRATLIRLLRSRDAIAAAQALPAPDPQVTWTRSPAPAGWLVDGDAEAPVAEHRAAHAAGRPSEAAVAYGAGVPVEATADRLLELAALAAEGDGLRAVCPVPGEGDAGRPGSWGVEDLTVLAATRLAMPGVPWVRPDWRRLGPGLCQVALAFGANDWVIPEGDRSDPALLAQAVGRTAVPR